MCLAIPLQIVETIPDKALGIVQAGESTMAVGLALVPEAKVGDFVLVHAGTAIDIVDEAEAQETLALYREYANDPDLFTPKGKDEYR